MEKYEALALLYDLPSLDIPCKYYSFPNIIKKISVNVQSEIRQCVMVSASSDKPAIKIDRMAFKYELKRHFSGHKLVKLMIHTNLEQQMVTRRTWSILINV